MGLESTDYIGGLDPNNPEGTDGADTLDQHDRLIKGALRQSFPGFTGAILVGGTTGGSANAYTLSPATALPSLVAGMMVVVKIHAANTGASTFNISGLGAITAVTVSGAALTSGDLPANRYAAFVYDGTNLQLMAVTKNYVDQLSFNTVLPAQVDGVLNSDGTNASFSPLLRAGTMRFADSTDTTKRAAFDVSGVATGTTRTINILDRDVTLSSPIRVPRTSNTMLGAGDTGSFIDITSGTFTQTFDAAATLGNGWFVWLRNSGTGDITLDPNASETIDGLTSFVMYPGEVRSVQCDGTALRSFVVTPFLKTFTSSGTFTKPPGYSAFGGLLWGAGAGGGKRQVSADNASGGGGGACVPFELLASLFGATSTVTIGAGGAKGAIAGGNGAVGGNSSFTLASGTVTAYGGGGGFQIATGTVCYGGGGGGALSAGQTGGASITDGGNPILSGMSTPLSNTGFGGGAGNAGGAAACDSGYGGGGGGGTTSVGATGPGGSSVYGGGGGGSASGGSSTSTSGGGSKHGGAGGNGGYNTSATDGAAPGGGGGACASTNTTTHNAGDGARGELRIWGIA